jgi:CO dehydrogenase/acetyl-CoA synthase epsilon subunit
MVVTMVATPKMVAKMTRKTADRKLFIKGEKVCCKNIFTNSYKW